MERRAGVGVNSVSGTVRSDERALTRDASVEFFDGFVLICPSRRSLTVSQRFHLASLCSNNRIISYVLTLFIL